jgi:uncharacterized protein YdhG (YjbR/CyaY superfamily)
MTGPEAVAAYLAALSPDQRATLQDLRALIAAHLPGATECLSYAMPGFRHPTGKMIAGYAAFTRHCGLYPHSGTVIPALLPDCAGFKTSKSGILFTPANPLPAPLLRKILDTRLAEIASKVPRQP